MQIHHRQFFKLTLLITFGIVCANAVSLPAHAWFWRRRTYVPMPEPTAAPTVNLSESSCGGMNALPAHNVEAQNGYLLQNLTHPGLSLEGIPNAYQGKRLRFGSCSMAASLTLLNGYVHSHRLHVAPSENPFFKLGTLTPLRRKWWLVSVGESDEAVEDNFSECYGRYAANASGMAQCLAQKLGASSCSAGTCPTPRVDTFEGDLSHRRAYLRQHFGNPDPSQILPLAFTWDTRVVLGPPQLWEGDVKLVHVSALIGRRVTPQGRCELLVRNSWGTCSTWQQTYAHGTCDNFGNTDDVWVEEESLLKRSDDELTVLRD